MGELSWFAWLTPAETQTPKPDSDDAPGELHTNIIISAYQGS